MAEKSNGLDRRNLLLGGTIIAAAAAISLATRIDTTRAQGTASGKPPNILVIMGDDIDYWNVSAYNQGMMGYRTPTSTASLAKARCSRTPTRRTAAPLAARRSSPARARFEPACSRSACPAARRG